MKALLGSFLLVVATTAQSVPYTGTLPAYILGKFNTMRSNIAMSREPWNNGSTTIDSNLYWPGSKKTFQLRWDAGLATNCSKRLDSLVGLTMSYPNPPTVTEIHVGLQPNTSFNNKVTAKQMFDQAWTIQWYPWLQTHAVPQLQYEAPSDFGYYESYKTQTYRMISGNAQKIGCAYKNITDTYYLLCQLSPGGLTIGVNAYPPANLCEICSQCPTTAPCNKATGLCVVKATGK